MSVLAAFVVPHPPIILPEVGRGEERKIQKTMDAYREVMRRAAAYAPDTVVLTSPHSVMYGDYLHISPGARGSGNFRQFGAPYVEIHAAYDVGFVTELSRCAQKEGLAAGILGERSRDLDHGTMVPLRFLNEFDTDYKLVRIGLSGLPPLVHYRLGQCIARTAKTLGRRVVMIASGDLSHKLTEEGSYGYAPQGPDFDRQVTEALAAGDFLSLLRLPLDFCEAAAECGLRSFLIMAGALDGKAVTAELLSYEGPFGVGYGVAAFDVTGDDETRRFGEQYEQEIRMHMAKVKAEEDPWVRLARLSLETYITTGRRAVLPEDLPKTMAQSRAGVFVSLKKHGRLRGCIGTVMPTTASVAEEILHNAVSAAAEDPRFEPVEADELPELTYSVDVLGEAERIDSPEQLDVKRYGVIVEAGGRRGLLLPNLEGVDTVSEQIAISKQKAGISPEAPVKLWRFEVVRHR